MNLRDRSIAFAAVFLGAAWGGSHGCSMNDGDQGASAYAGEGPDAEAQDAAENPGTCNCVCPPAEKPAPRKLLSFTELNQSLEAGYSVRAVLRYAKCDLDGAPGPNAVGGMDIGVYEYFAKGVVGNPQAYLATSENKLIHMQSGKVFNYVKLSIREDDTVEIRAQYLNPTDFTVKMDETFKCRIDDGTGTAGVELFSR